MLAYWPLLSMAVLLAYPVYMLLMAGVLRLCGVPKDEIANWALRQADRQRFTDLLRAARGLEPPPADTPPALPAPTPPPG
ncbi:hypothetical protein GCM10009609_07740 [Pseudonocardia aurantiaca]|uniref:Uncharacterized protein n=1 Tax=Pseudonocardia aurantiaca TaxID=75290 RepID=A0ABW4FKY8_9PSEU